MGFRRWSQSPESWRRTGYPLVTCTYIRQSYRVVQDTTSHSKSIGRQGKQKALTQFNSLPQGPSTRCGHYCSSYREIYSTNVSLWVLFTSPTGFSGKRKFRSVIATLIPTRFNRTQKVSQSCLTNIDSYY